MSAGGHGGESDSSDQSLELELQYWREGLRADGAQHEQVVTELRALLLRVARSELARRRHQLGSLQGPELDDIAEQAADDAVLKVIAKLDEFRGASRFTTWAYKFAIFEVSAKVALQASRHLSSDGDAGWEEVPDSFALSPEQNAEQREALAVLSRAIDEELTDRQRQVFVAVAVNDAPMDAVALELGSNRNALYKNLFDARRKLRRALARAGHDLGEGR